MRLTAMKSKTVNILVLASITGVIVMFSFFAHNADPARVRTPHQQVDEFSTILYELVVSLPEGPINESEREALAKQRKQEQKAVEKLQQLGTNCLPRLMAEVRAVGRVEATNRVAAMEPTRRITRAFEILGTDAKPLLPMLVEELHTGRSVGPSMAGIVKIGGTDAGIALVRGLTNSDSTIRNWTMSALSSFASDRDVSLAAVPSLLRLLKDDFGFSRALAASVLGTLRQEPDTVIPTLIQLAKNDSDFVVRSSAIKAIGRFGTNAAPVKADLDGIAVADKEASVRRIAAVAAQSARGEIPADKVQ